MLAGFGGDAAGGASSSQDLTAATDDDTIDLLFVHIAWDLTPSGKGLKLSEASQFDASTAPLQHTQHAMAMPAGMDTTAESGHWQCAGSSAALHQWLDGLIRSLLQYSMFSSSVLTAILLRNQEADNMLQVWLWRCLQACLESRGCRIQHCLHMLTCWSVHSYMFPDARMCIGVIKGIRCSNPSVTWLAGFLTRCSV